MDQSQIDNQLFHMFDGSFKTAKDLQLGDQLMSIDSTPCTIQRLDQVEETCYSVTPVKGDSYTIGASDALSLSFTSSPSILWDENRQKYNVIWFDRTEIKERSTGFSIHKYGNKENALENAEKYKDSLNIDRKFSLSVAKYLKLGKPMKADIKGFKISLNFPDREFLIDPYFIGYWLGDGSSGDSTLTIGDEDIHIVDYFKAYFQNNFNLQFNKQGVSIHYRVTTGERGHSNDGKNVILRYLRDKNLYNNKHIPLEFLHSSRESRLRLLAGLLDSDGSLNNNCYDFIQKREQLFNDVIYLARSLGFSCYKKKCKKTCTNAAGGPKIGDYFRCTISGKGLEEIPNLIPRKRANPRQQIKDALVTGITLKDVGVFKNYHIYTDQKQYLLADFTVRHKHEIYFAPFKSKII